jgi:hypothetical protein
MGAPEPEPDPVRDALIATGRLPAPPAPSIEQVVAELGLGLRKPPRAPNVPRGVYQPAPPTDWLRSVMTLGYAD